MNQPTLALSVRQPWAWLILHAGKDIENRMWRTNFRGRIHLHAGKAMTRDDYEAAKLFCMSLDQPPETFPEFDALKGEMGGIVGAVTITDCVTSSPSPWFMGDYGFVLADALPATFRPCRGALNFFKPVF